MFYEGGGAGVFDFGESVFGIPVVGAGDEAAGICGLELGVDLVAVVVVGGGEGVDGGVLVEGVDGVIVRARKGEAVGGFFAIADAVILIGAVEGVGGIIGGDELTEGIIGPGGAVGGSTTAGGVGSLADGVHGIADAADGAVIASAGVGFCQQDVAMILVGVADGVGGAVDAADEVAVGGVAVGECLAWRLESAATDGTEAAVGGGVAVGDVLLYGRGGSGRLQGVVFVALEGVLFVVDDAGEFCLIGDVVSDGFFVEGEGGGIVVVIGACEAVGLDIGAAEAVMGG